MSATVLGCGHTSHQHLFTVDIVVTAPQVHLHFLTGEEEYMELGYGKVELCCHGCGASTLVYYVDNDNSNRSLQVRNDFTKKHEKCPNRNYQSSCPDWRTSFKVIDIRQKVVKWNEPVKPLVRRRAQKKEMFPTTQRPQPRVRKSTENS